MDVQPIKDVLSDLSILLAKKSPVLYYMLKKCSIKYDPDLPYDAGTYKNVIIFADSFLKRPKGEQLFILMHELLHIILFHSFRAQNNLTAEQTLVQNYAADYIVNNTLIKDFSFNAYPEDIVLDLPINADWKTDSMEEIAQKLAPKVNEIRGFEWKDLLTELPDATTVTEGIPVVGEGEIEKEVIAAAYAAAGTGDPFTERLRRDLMKASVNWRATFRTVIRSIKNQSNTTWIKRNRRSKKLPGITQTKHFNIWALVDVSGSVSDELFTQFLSELYAMKDNRVTLNVLYWSNSVTDVFRKVSKQELLENMPRGYGGTELEPALQFLEKEKDVDVCIVLSDFYVYESPKELRKYIKADKEYIYLTDGKQIELPGRWIHLK